MPALSEYTNVYGTAIALLRKKGYQVWRDESGATFQAERDGWDFLADSPLGLLGLVAIFEARNPARHEEYWWRMPESDGAYLTLPHGPERPYTPVWQRTPRE